MAHMPADQRRQQLVEAAMHVISRDGVAKASTRRIADEAGAPLASLHYSFRSKEQLFEEVLRHAVEAIESLLRDSRVLPESGLVDAVELVIGAFHGPMLDGTDPIRAQFELLFWTARNDESGSLPGDTYRAYFDGMVALFKSAATRDETGADMYHLARVTAAFIDGMLVQMLLAQDPYWEDANFRAIARGLVSIVLAGSNEAG